MEVILTYQKGKNKGAIALWVNDDNPDTQELIKRARKQIESRRGQSPLTGDESWSIRRGVFNNF